VEFVYFTLRVTGMEFLRHFQQNAPKQLRWPQGPVGTHSKAWRQVVIDNLAVNPHCISSEAEVVGRRPNVDRYASIVHQADCS
jgi:hypothetical protein